MSIATRKISKNFYLHEFVGKEIYDRFLKSSRWYIRPELIELAEFYREWFEAPVIINNWFWGGPHKERGHRVPDSKTGTKYSQHKLGTAFDCTIKGLTANQVRKEIFDNYREFMKAGLTTLEHEDYAPTWVHSDIRDTGLTVLLVVKPSIGAAALDSNEDTNEYFKWKDGALVPIEFN